jgi:hypothetical protein
VRLNDVRRFRRAHLALLWVMAAGVGPACSSSTPPADQIAGGRDLTADAPAGSDAPAAADSGDVPAFDGPTSDALADDIGRADGAGADGPDGSRADAADGAPGADGGLAGSFGQPCQVDQPTSCQSGLFCLQGPNGGNDGFCSKTCPPNSGGACPGAPAGTAAYCVVTDVDLQGDKGCAFVCKEGATTYTCPGTLQCQTTEDPPGSGQYLCLP